MNLLVYVIVAMIVRRQFDLAVPLCEAHKARRKKLLWIGIVLLVVCFPGAFLVGALFNGEDALAWAVVVSISSLIAGVIIIAPCRSTLVPKYIDETRATFKGSGEAYLSMLPTAPEHRPTS